MPLTTSPSPGRSPPLPLPEPEPLPCPAVTPEVEQIGAWVLDGQTVCTLVTVTVSSPSTGLDDLRAEVEEELDAEPEVEVDPETSAH